MLNIIKKSLIFIENNYKLISYSILIIAFIFSRLPFFVWFPIPEFYNDTPEYFHHAYELSLGHYPDISYLPPGYIFFIYLTGLISNKIITIVLLQNLFTLFSSLLLVFTTLKFYKKIGIFVSFAGSIFIMDTVSIYHDTNLLTESIYTSSLIFFISMFIFAVNSKNKFVWIIFSVSFFIPAFIRSNGIYTYCFWALILVYMFINKFNRKYYFYLILPFFTVNFLWASYNYVKSDIFMFGNPGRYSTELIKNINKIHPRTNKPQPHNRIKTFTMYWLQTGFRNNNFYFVEIPRRYQDLYIYNDRKNNKEYSNIFGSFVVDKNLQNYIYKEYISTVASQKLTENVLEADVYNSLKLRNDTGKRYKNLWLFAYYNYYLFHNLFFRNLIWLIIFLYIFVKTTIKLYKSKFTDKNAFIINTLILLYVFSNIIITVMHGRYIDRYEKVISFLFYIVPALYLYSSENFNILFKKIKLVFINQNTKIYS